MPYYIVKERDGMAARYEVTKKLWDKIGFLLAEDMKKGLAHAAAQQPGDTKEAGRARRR